VDRARGPGLAERQAGIAAVDGACGRSGAGRRPAAGRDLARQQPVQEAAADQRRRCVAPVRAGRIDRGLRQALRQRQVESAAAPRPASARRPARRDSGRGPALSPARRRCSAGSVVGGEPACGGLIRARPPPRPRRCRTRQAEQPGGGVEPAAGGWWWAGSSGRGRASGPRRAASGADLRREARSPSSRPSACSSAAAMRQGSRAATSPPGRRSGGRWPTRQCSVCPAAPAPRHPRPGRRHPGPRRRVPAPPVALRTSRARPEPPRHARGGAARRGRQRPSRRAFEGQARAEEVGVQVVRHGVQRSAGALTQRRHRGPQRGTGRGRAQVAMRRRPPHLVAVEQAGRILQKGAAGQHPRRCGHGQGLAAQFAHHAAGCSSQSSQASMPTPLRDDTSSTSTPGLTRCA
jgi:hypothetical protein